MLEVCKAQFSKYAQNHREKAERYKDQLNEEINSSSKEQKQKGLLSLIADTEQKAYTNEMMVAAIDKVLNHQEFDPISDIVNFADIAYVDGVDDKARQTQVGVHFEEVAEMIDTLSSNDAAIRYKLEAALTALVELGMTLKQSEPALIIKNRADFLDACCDQIVTSTLSAVLNRMQIIPAMTAVNASNRSKLVDGVMTKDPVTKKWLKGPNYFKPELNPFV